MARKNSFGKMLAVSMAAAVVGGVAAYLRRKEIEGVVRDIADALDAKEDDGFFSADLGDEPVFHKVPADGENAPEQAPAGEAPAEEPPVEETPVEETPAAQAESAHEESAPAEASAEE